jgi:ATP-dependent helicase/nuclease subunit B
MPNSANSAEGEAWPTLTVNTRLARWRLLEYNEAQNQSGLKAWPTPEILPLTAWLKQVWMQSWPDQYFLTPLQTEKLWAQIVRQTSWKFKLDLLHLKETAKKAQEAYSLIQQYRLPLDREKFSQTEEGNLFLGWAQTYQKWLATHNALDPSSILDAVNTSMSKGLIPLPNKILFAGFEEITPQFKAWLEFLKSNNVQIRFDPTIPEKNQPTLTSLKEGRNIEIRKYTNNVEEAIQCSRWVRATFQPEMKIGIVVPDMKSYRSLLNRELAAELSPASVFPWVEKKRPFNISLGTPLAEEPMINIALQILSTRNTAVSVRVFLSVIKSLYFSVGQNESPLSHQLEIKLLKNNFVTVYLQNFEKQFKLKNSEPLILLINKWKDFIGNRNVKHLPGQWGKEFTSFLSDLGWPKAKNSLTGKEFQVYESWKECLDKLASLDSILGQITQRQATETLTDILQEHSFQVKTNESPIQAVGLLESAGMRFDHLWVMGCHSEILPALPSPNPFLPVEFRKQYNLPHSTAQRELEFAENSLRRLMTSSKRIIFSFPAMEKNSELKISPLLLPLGGLEEESQAPFILDSHRLKDQVFLDKPLQRFEETVTLPATAQEKSVYTEKGPGGGYAIIKDQAECPFRSFANHRLNTDTLEFSELDFDNRERGILVHQTLEIFWKEIRSLNSLLNLASNNRLIATIESAVEKALTTHHESHFLKQPRFYRLEKERVVDLIRQWLDLEMSRSEFEVLDQEKDTSLTISGVKLRLRMDRIDKTSDGKILLIDYKTGDIKINDWFGERIKEPQLPLYAFKQSPHAILYGQVKKGSHKLTGAIDPAATDIGVTAIKPKRISELTECSDGLEWDALLNYWKKKLTSLAGQFLSGQTKVDPVDGATTCRNCGLTTLCRIQNIDTEIINAEEE